MKVVNEFSELSRFPCGRNYITIMEYEKRVEIRITKERPKRSIVCQK